MVPKDSGRFFVDVFFIDDYCTHLQTVTDLGVIPCQCNTKICHGLQMIPWSYHQIDSFPLIKFLRHRPTHHTHTHTHTRLLIHSHTQSILVSPRFFLHVYDSWQRFCRLRNFVSFLSTSRYVFLSLTSISKFTTYRTFPASFNPNIFFLTLYVPFFHAKIMPPLSLYRLCSILPCPPITPCVSFLQFICSTTWVRSIFIRSLKPQRGVLPYSTRHSTPITLISDLFKVATMTWASL